MKRRYLCSRGQKWMVFILSSSIKWRSCLQKHTLRYIKSVFLISSSMEETIWTKLVFCQMYITHWEHATLYYRDGCIWWNKKMLATGSSFLTFKYKIITNFSVIFKNHCVKTDCWTSFNKTQAKLKLLTNTRLREDFIDFI